MHHFNYIWFDKARKMYYIGTHSGHIDDQYISSSRWFTGEVRYRPNDFKRRILQHYSSKAQARKAEALLLTRIKPEEWGTKYYNLRTGSKLGRIPSNKGKAMSKEQKDKISAALKGRTFSDEHKASLSVAGKRRQDRNRGSVG